MTAAAAIIGPTASGKSALALAVAEAINAEIISVDSGALYRGMDIGTATPDATMLARIPHHLINITDPCDTYNAARFYHDATAAIQQIRARGKKPLLVGGSMMYFNTLFNGLTIMPPVPPALEQAVRQEAHDHGIAALYQELQQADSDTAAKLAAYDKQRIIRAVCLYRSSGKPRSAWTQKYPPLKLLPLLLLPSDREVLRERIRQRLDSMWDSGLLAETRQIMEQWQLPPDAPPLKMAGYAQALAHHLNQYDAATMRQKAYYATSQLAKRQLTWLQKWRNNACVVEPFAGDNAAAQAVEFFSNSC